MCDKSVKPAATSANDGFVHSPSPSLSLSPSMSPSHSLSLFFSLYSLSLSLTLSLPQCLTLFFFTSSLFLTPLSLQGGFISNEWLNKPEPNVDKLKNVSLRKYYPWIRYWGGWSLFQEMLNVLNVIANKYSVSISNVAVRCEVKGSSFVCVIHICSVTHCMPLHATCLIQTLLLNSDWLLYGYLTPSGAMGPGPAGCGGCDSGCPIRLQGAY